MGAKRVTVRIVGFASTTRGFAFVVTEGPRRLVDWGLHRLPSRTAAVTEALELVLNKARPLFVAFDGEGARLKRIRGKRFGKAVTKSCETAGVMILPVSSDDIQAFADAPRPTKWHVAVGVSKLFPEIVGKLPAKRKPWQSEDDRIGLFMALAAAVAGWDSFKKKER